MTTKSFSQRVETDDWMLVFAAVILIVAGIMRIFDGIWAFAYKGSVPENLQNAIFGHSLKTYGWLWLIMGVLLVLAGLGVLVQHQIARWFGVVVAGLAAVSAVWWMPYYPIWSITYVGVGVLVIYALIAHGKRASVS